MVSADEAQPQQQSNATWDCDAELWLVRGCLKGVFIRRLPLETFAVIRFHDVLRTHSAEIQRALPTPFHTPANLEVPITFVCKFSHPKARPFATPTQNRRGECPSDKYTILPGNPSHLTSAAGI